MKKNETITPSCIQKLNTCMTMNELSTNNGLTVCYDPKSKFSEDNLVAQFETL